MRMVEKLVCIHSGFDPRGEVPLMMMLDRETPSTLMDV
jgi:hypothetical protein